MQKQYGLTFQCYLKLMELMNEQIKKYQIKSLKDGSVMENEEFSFIVNCVYDKVHKFHELTITALDNHTIYFIDGVFPGLYELCK